MSCDVTERDFPVLSQSSRGQRVKRERLGTRLVERVISVVNYGVEARKERIQFLTFFLQLQCLSFITLVPEVFILLNRCVYSLSAVFIELCDSRFSIRGVLISV